MPHHVIDGKLWELENHTWRYLGKPPAKEEPVPDWTAPAPQSLDFKLSADTPYFIGPCIQPGDLTYFVGSDGQGKSTLVADLIVSVVGSSLDLTPASCLGGRWRIRQQYFPTESRVLIVNAETADINAWKRKIQATNLSYGHPPNSDADNRISSHIDFVDAEDIPLRPNRLEEDAARFAEWAAAYGYRLIIFDPIYGTFRPPEPGSDTWVSHGLRPMIVTLKALGVTTFAIAHPNGTAMKSKKPRDADFSPFGSSQQRGLMDCRFGVVSTPGATHSTTLVKFKARRAGWIPNECAKIDLLHGPEAGFKNGILKNSAWELYNPNPATLTDTVRDVIRALPADPFFTKDFESTKRTSFDRVVDDYLIKQDLLIAERQEGRGRPILYTWTDVGLRVHGSLTGRTKGPSDVVYESTTAEKLKRPRQ